MPADKPKFYITTPIYYTNGLPHIGHTYSTIVCDTIRRYKRMRGYDVVMTTGTDEHGVNVERSAKKAGVPESEFVAKMAAEWRALWDELGVEGDLRDLSITRTSIRWGIPVPGEEPHVFYVWFDALTAYLSAVGGPQYEKTGFWPADLHLVGKEIIRFHAVYWPAFLMAAGLPLPKQIWAHGWFLMDSAKMSKSLGNVVRPRPIVHVLGMDALRYYLLRETVFGQDGNFSYDALVQRYNSDLANGLGNLASRTLTMIEQNCSGQIPALASEHVDSSASVLREMFRPAIWMIVGNAVTNDPGHYNEYQFSLALQDIWQLISHVDSYLVREKPWVLAKDTAKAQELANVLYDAAEALRIITILAHPVLPSTTEQIWKQ